MNPRSLEIQIIGAVDSGKTTISALIQKTLAEHGFTNVSIVAQGDVPCDNSLEQLLEQNRALDLPVLNTPIKLTEHTVRKTRHSDR